MEAGVHQGVYNQLSALSPLLFALVKDRMTDEVGTQAPWMMMFSVIIVLCSEDQEKTEEK